jgi:hypothetical protein
MDKRIYPTPRNMVYCPDCAAEYDALAIRQRHECDQRWLDEMAVHEAEVAVHEAEGTMSPWWTA